MTGLNKFDISTFGVSGVLSMKKARRCRLDDGTVPKNWPNKIELGVVISTLSIPYGKTKRVTIVPRYVILNETDVPLIVGQHDDKEPMQYYVAPGSKFSLFNHGRFTFRRAFCCRWL